MSESRTNRYAEATTVIPCHLAVTHHRIHNATELIKRLADVFNGHNINGIVWATNGTWQLLGIDSIDRQTEPILASNSASFDNSRTYEIRAWQIIDCTNEDSTLAHEFRWVNGLPACELRLLRMPKEDNLPPGELAHYISYIQHTDQPKATERARPKHISAFEYIKIDADTGNTAVVDQLFTGNWHSQLT